MVLSAVRQIVSRWVTHLSHICQKMLAGMKNTFKKHGLLVGTDIAPPLSRD